MYPRTMKSFIARSARAALIVAVAVCAPVAHGQQKPVAAKPHLTVYKSPTCGCCAKWVEYMQANGFTAAVTNMPDVAPVKAQRGVPARLASCHTTLVGGYVIEGHVPVEDVRRLLQEKPAVVGLAAPGMPAGSPGMDVPNSPPYDVVSFDKDGRVRVYANHRPK
jgi:hypothetical protein